MKTMASDLEVEFDGKEVVNLKANTSAFYKSSMDYTSGKLRTLIEIFDHSNHANIYMCSIDNPRNPYTVPGIPPIGTPERDLYLQFAENVVNSCPSWVLWVNSGLDVTDLRIANIHVPDGTRIDQEYTREALFHSITISSSDTSCSASIIKDMSFGVIPIDDSSTVPEAVAQVIVECSRNSTITLSVNNGKGLSNPDGSLINFYYPGSHELPSNSPWVINILGSLEVVPSKPGFYSWSVPITVSFY